VLPEVRRGKLDWETVEILRDAGLYEVARIAREIVLRDEQRRNRWYRRLGRRLFRG